ncbi:MAG: glyoxalase [Segetibacter sp.]|nr:glyoxalase [Segetibacter sp.]
MKNLITGIQQVGIGVANANEAKYLYKDLFGMDVLIFEDRAEALLMTKYTGNQVHNRHAILSMNLSGGGGFEIWQFTSRAPGKQTEQRFGDLGIFAPRIKSKNAEAAYHHFKSASSKPFLIYLKARMTGCIFGLLTLMEITLILLKETNGLSPERQFVAELQVL